MIGELRDVMVRNKHVGDLQKMEEIFVGRWEKMNIPIHCEDKNERLELCKQLAIIHNKQGIFRIIAARMMQQE